MSRPALIERKELVRAEIGRARQELARLQQGQVGAGDRRRAHQSAALEARLAALMAEEHALRLQIDRT